MAQMNAVDWHYDDSKRPEVVPFVPRGTHTLLDVGCGRGAFGAHLKSLQAIEVHGVEINPIAATQARERLDQVFQGDLEHSPELVPAHTYDCVTFLDVLEHMQDPWSLLRQSTGWLRPAGVVVASIPNVRYYPVLKELLLQKTFRYQNNGVLDRTHLRFFTELTIRELFEVCGFQVDRLEGINGLPFPWKWGALNRLCGGFLEDTRYIQFIVVAKPL